MRQAINENRTVQLVLLGVLALVGGFMLLKAKGGGEETAAPVAPVTPPAATGAASIPATVPATAPVTGAAAGAPAGGLQVPVEMIPGPSLPQSLVSAYNGGDAIALLVRRAGGIDDALVHDSVEQLNAMSGVAVFVTKARQIARYAWLTQGVNVTDLPALVVLLPKKLSKGTPTATVSYGFRDSASVVQAVEDALYDGPKDRPYHP
jgi:hypothetical protein